MGIGRTPQGDQVTFLKHGGVIYLFHIRSRLLNNGLQHILVEPETLAVATELSPWSAIAPVDSVAPLMGPMGLASLQHNSDATFELAMADERTWLQLGLTHSSPSSSMRW